MAGELVTESRVGLAMADSESNAPYQSETMIAALVREALLQGGLGRSDPAVPLADVIEPGMTVLLKPNWVLHYNKGGHGMDCLVTHPAFIKAALKEVLAARPGRVIIGDAPIQDCAFGELVTQKLIDEFLSLAGPTSVDVVDFRRTIRRHDSGRITVEEGVKGEGEYILFDLAEASLLEPISDPPGRFRITNYHPDRLAARHRKGKHEYFLSRVPFEADVVLNLPKLKTHMKAGLTACLKNLVGINGDKDYLPHHRLGGSSVGGDCYPGRAPLLRTAEFFLDCANRRMNTSGYYRWRRLAGWARGLHRRVFTETGLEGGWFGNDTVWRMCLDLNRMLLYGRTDGSMAGEPQRSVFNLTDALVAGQGNGPLYPEPVHLGAVTFAASSAFADLCHAALMGFDWHKIPLVREAFGAFPYRLAMQSPESLRVHLAGKGVSLDQVAARGKRFRPPPGWIGHVERG